MQSAAIIPSYNCGPTITHVASTAAKFVDKAIVVSDGSTDNTRNVFTDLSDNDYSYGLIIRGL